MFRTRTWLVLVGLLATTGYGCAPAIVAGGATAVVVSQDRRTVGAQLDDENIEIKVANMLRADPELKDQAHINIVCYNGAALLTGEAPTTALRDRVLSLVRAVPGVRRTVNEIRVAPPSESTSRNRDTFLTAKTKTRLLSTPDLGSSHIKVVTEGGSVYLMGLVSKAQGELATEAARDVDGVQRVVKLFEYIE
jgi:osmotically-inducible protein OsmY